MVLLCEKWSQARKYARPRCARARASLYPSAVLPHIYYSLAAGSRSIPARYIPRQIPKQRNCMVTSWIVMDSARCGISSFQRLSLWQREATWKIYGENVHLISNKYLLRYFQRGIWIRVSIDETSNLLLPRRFALPRWTRFPLMTHGDTVLPRDNVTITSNNSCLRLFIYLMTSIYKEEKRAHYNPSENASLIDVLSILYQC